MAAVLDRVRDELGARAEAVLGQAQPPMVALEALVRTLLDFAAEHPGFPRLLFQDLAQQDGSQTDHDGLHAKIRLLASMQESLFEGLLREAAARGALPPRVGPQRAARLLLTLVQGAILRQRLHPEEPPAATRAAELLAFFRRGLEADFPPETGADTAAAMRSERCELLRLDARPLLAAGEDPFREIQRRLAALTPDGLFVLEVPFRPGPLLARLAAMGFAVEEEIDAQGLHRLLVRGPEAPPLVDLRGLEPPEPLQRVLERTERLAPGELLLARVPRMPRFLLSELARRHFPHRALEAADASAFVAVRAPKPEGER